MKEGPILMNGEMVRATLALIKRQTRRILDNQPCGDVPVFMKDDMAYLKNEYGVDIPLEHCKFGKVGDRLWVRETCQAWEYELSGEDVVRYVADGAFRPIEQTQNGMERWIELRNYRGKKGAIVPSIHMPRWASRIMLEIVSVRVERLNDISEEDAKAEGADCLITANCTPQSRALLDMPLMDDAHPYRNGFALLWESINGERSWAANPWVWAIEFKAVKP